jgi:hypothetical protein
VRVTQKCGRIFRTDISNLGRIIWPPSKTAKDQKDAGCASPRSQSEILARLFQIWAGLSGPNLTRIIRSWRLQRIYFGEGYSSPACSSSSRTRHYLEPTSLLDLHLQPPIVPDLWRIEGGGPDLHLHQRNFISLSICLGNLCLVVPWKH